MTYLKRMGVLLAGVLAACGGSDSVSLDELPDALASAQCERLVRCGLYTSAADCEAAINFNITEIQHSVEAGRVAYDGEAVAECLDTLGSASCDLTTESARVTPQSCKDAIKGAVAAGGTCYDSGDCQSARCDLPDCGNACCMGTCQDGPAEVTVGQSCADAPCDDRSFCQNGTCQALLASGAACQGSDECGFGLMCGNDACTAAAHRGDACVDGDCAEIGDRCDSTDHCAALVAVGGACSGGIAGLFDCQRPLVCNDTTLKCEAAPTAGQACQFFCGGNLFCNDQNTCEAPRADGAACGSNSECASDFCDDVTSKCAALPLCG